MKWLNKLEDYNLSFKVKIIYKNDCIIADKNLDEHKILVILDGFMQKIKTFTNGETITLKLLYSTDVFTNTYIEIRSPCLKTNYYYKFKALTDTIIIVLNRKELDKKTKKHYSKSFLLHEIYHYENNDILKILAHQNIAKRIIQLLLILTQHFGKVRKDKIYIPFNLSQNNIANIVGSQRVTVNRIMNKFKPNILYYDDKQIIIFNIIQLIQL